MRFPITTNRRILPNAALAGLILAGFGVSAAGAAHASLHSMQQNDRDSIRVMVNGDEVQFNNVGPREIGGRMMVPLRGVLERIGANVDWVQASQTVVATRGRMTIELSIGSRVAHVNGRTVQLDVPAMTIADSTMVPLRFVTESLGGTVAWDRQTRTVSIETGGQRNRGNEANRPEQETVASDRGGERGGWKPTINSITHNLSHDEIAPGQRFRLEMHGTQGGQAWFRIRGTFGELKMTETDPGVYKGSWVNNQDRPIHVDEHDILAFIVVKNTSTPETMPDGIKRP